MLPAALSPPPLNMHMDEVSERQEGLLLRLPERWFFYILVLRLVLCAMERALTWVCKGCQMSVEETVECTAQTCFSLMYTTSRVQDLEEMLCRTILGLLFM